MHFTKQNKTATTHWGWTAAVDSAALVTAVCGLLWLVVNPDEGIEKGCGGISRGINSNSNS